MRVLLRDRHCRGWASCFACVIICGFFAAEGPTALHVRSVVASFLRMVEPLRLRDRSWVCCRGWPRFGCAILDDCMSIRGLRNKSSDPMFACAILGLLRQSLDPRFAQQNPRTVLIHTLRLTYIYIYIFQAVRRACPVNVQRANVGLVG